MQFNSKNYSKKETIESSLDAFAEDSSYIIAMLKQAVNIKNKRENYKLRDELRAVESEARKKCSSGKPFSCTLLTPCGVGLCPYAEDDYQDLIASDLIEADDPKPQGGKAHSINPVVVQLRERRGRANFLE